MRLINKILYEELKPRLWSLLLILGLIFLTVAFESITPWPFKVLIDNVLGSQRPDAASLQGKIFSFFTSRQALGFFAAMVYCLSAMAVSIADYAVGSTTKRLSKDVIKNFSGRAFGNLERIASGYYRQKEVGDYIYRLSYDVSALGELLEAGLIPIVTNSLYLVVTVVIMFMIDVKLAFVALAVLPLLALGLAVFNRSIGAASKRSETSNSALLSFIQEVLSQLKIIQAYNREKQESRLFDQKEESSLTGEMNVNSLGFLLNLMIGIVIAIGYSLVIVYGVKLVFLEEISTGLLILFILYLDNLTNPLLSLISASSILREEYEKVSRMGEFFSSSHHVRNAGSIAEIPTADIVFHDVSVFGKEGEPILKGASFTIPAGKKTVIVGVSGSGKTTIATLLLRLLEPDRGRILIGNKRLHEYSLKNLRDAIAYVPQEIIIFHDTIRNNIAFGNPDATPEEIELAARQANAEAFIKRLPRGYAFEVGEEGTNLSGGQRQRLMLARAFLKKHASILVFDEPLSALDIRNRQAVMSNIVEFAAGKTTIIISNVLEILHQADRVIVINEGEIIHVGDWSSLKSQSHLAHLILHAG